MITGSDLIIYIDIMNFICLNSNTSCHILNKTYQDPVTKVKMNLQGRQDRKYMFVNLPILEDNLHVEYTIFMFSLSVRYVMCLCLSQSWHFLKAFGEFNNVSARESARLLVPT